MVILLGAGLTLSFGVGVVLAAFAVDAIFCRSRLVGPVRPPREAPSPLPRVGPARQPLSRRAVSAEAG